MLHDFFIILSFSLRPRLRPRILENGSLLPNHHPARYEIQLPHHLERARPLTDALAHDDALADAFDLVPLHVPRRVEQVVGRLLEAGELQHAVPHLAQPEARDAEHLAFVGHDVGEELHVPGVNVHGAHDQADFVDDGLAGRFDAEDLAHLHDGVRSGREPVHPFGRHAVAETIAFDQQFILAIVVSLDDSTGRFGISTDGDVGEDAFDRLYTEKELRVFFRGGFGRNVLGATLVLLQRLDINADMVLVTFNMMWAQFELLLSENRVGDISGGDV